MMFEYTDFMAGQLYPNDRPGLGVTLDVTPLTQIGGVNPSRDSPQGLQPPGRSAHPLVEPRRPRSPRRGRAYSCRSAWLGSTAAARSAGM